LGDGHAVHADLHALQIIHLAHGTLAEEKLIGLEGGG
jgi:hypothetical protein